MFKLKFLPATIGDSIWVSYGDPARPHHLLIDGGTRGTRDHIHRELRALTAERPRLDLMVVSHIDKDHIGGILTLLQRQEVAFDLDDFWYNGFHHLPEPEEEEDESMGALQAEQLTEELVKRNLPWNEKFGPRGQKPVEIPDQGPLPTKTLAGGMEITLLSPTREALAELRPDWVKEVEEARLKPGAVVPEDPSDDEEELGADELPDVAALAASDFEDDASTANGASIAFLARFEGKQVLFAADAHVGRLRDALERLSPGRRLKLDLFKISHHGSRTTTSRELIEKVECPRFVFSTKGSIYRHPHAEAVSRVIVAGGASPELFFNYRRPTNEIWDLDLLKQQHGYTTRYPEPGQEGIEITL